MKRATAGISIMGIFAMILAGQSPWRPYIREAKILLKHRKFSEAQAKILEAIERFPQQPELLLAASNTYRKAGRHKKSLFYAELLISRYPDLWKGYYLSAKELAALKRIPDALTIAQKGLQKFPAQDKLFSISLEISDAYRASCEYNIRKLLKKKDFKQAQLQIKEGLYKIPNDETLLLTAINVYRASGDPQAALGYATILTTYHQENWEGYYLAAQNLLELKRSREALLVINEGLSKAPHQFQLLTLAHDIHNESLNYQKSLEYANLLIALEPENWKGYVRAAKDMLELDMFLEAQTKIQEGLLKIPQQEGLLRVANQIFRHSGDYAESLKYANLLIKFHPKDWHGYYLAAQDLMVLEQFKKATQILEKGIGLISDATDQKFLEKQLYWSQTARDIHVNHKELFHSWRDSKTGIPNKALSGSQAGFDSTQRRQNLRSIQYWSQEDIPADVQEITETWNSILRNCGAERIRTWHKKEAHKWISINTPELEKAFTTAPHFAAESDVFRLAYTKAENCIYIDSDLYPKRLSAQILSAALDMNLSTFFCWANHPFIQNSFFISRLGCPVFPAIRDSLNGWDYSGKEITPMLIHESFGPRAYNETIKNVMSQSNSVQKEVIMNGALDKILLDSGNLLICNEETFAHMSKPGGLAYKKTELHWLNFCKNAMSSTDQPQIANSLTDN